MKIFAAVNSTTYTDYTACMVIIHEICSSNSKVIEQKCFALWQTCLILHLVGSPNLSVGHFFTILKGSGSHNACMCEKMWVYMISITLSPQGIHHIYLYNSCRTHVDKQKGCEVRSTLLLHDITWLDLQGRYILLNCPCLFQ